MTNHEPAYGKTPEHINRIVLQAAILKELKAVADADKKELHEVMGDGESLTAVDERGLKLGTISRTYKKPQAVVDDIAVVAAALPEGSLRPVIPEHMQARAAQLLAETHPEMVEWELPDSQVKHLADAAVAHYEATGETPVGWRIVHRPGYLTVRPAPLAANTAKALLGEALPQAALPGGEQ